MTTPRPNYTQFPNTILDAMPDLSESEFKIVGAIVRRTFGFHADRARLSIGFLQTLTGLARATTTKGLAALIDRNLIGREQVGDSFEYFLILDGGSSKFEPGVVQNLNRGSSKFEPGVVQNLNPLKERGKKEIKERGEAADVGGFVDAWNSFPGLPSIRAFSSGRKRKLVARLKDPFFAEHWKTALDKVAASNFCTGTNDRGWRADVDWFLQPDVCAKIMEGKYDNRKVSLPAGVRRGQRPPPRDAGLDNDDLIARIRAQQTE